MRTVGPVNRCKVLLHPKGYNGDKVGVESVLIWLGVFIVFTGDNRVLCLEGRAEGWDIIRVLAVKPASSR